MAYIKGKTEETLRRNLRKLKSKIMAGIVDMTHTAVKNKQKLRGNLKHLYLAFAEQVLNVFSLIVSVLKVLPLI